MRISKIVFFVVALLLTGIAVTAARAADDPANGTWKINLAKSKFTPGPAPQGATVTIKIDHNTESYEADMTDASGNTSHASFTAKLDGTDAALTGNPDGDTIAIKRISPSRLEAKIKKGGAVVQAVQVVVAEDGKSRTVTYNGKNAKGDKIHNVVVYDKQ